MTNRVVIDLDNTLTLDASSKSYADKLPNEDVVARLREMKELGFLITIFTARNMRSFDGNVGRINVVTLPIIAEWLRKHSVPHDEIVVGKPWCGHDGFYVDDKAVRPDEFVSLSLDEIQRKVGNK